MDDELERLRRARSYDGVGEVYEGTLAPRLFDLAARRLVAVATPGTGDRILDAGAGTGAVARAAVAVLGSVARVVAADPSVDMLAAARRGGVVHAVAAALPHLPFTSASFDLVYCAFVLTHVDNPDAAIAEMARVLRPGGRIGVSAWAPGDDEFTSAWSEVVMRFADGAQMARANAVVLPGDARFAQPTGAADALRQGGFAEVQTHDVDIDFRLTVEEYIEGREVCASGRALRALLADHGWMRFRADVRSTLKAKFPKGVAYTRRVFIVTGLRAKR